MQNEMCNSGNNSKKKMRNILIKAHVNVYDFTTTFFHGQIHHTPAA